MLLEDQYPFNIVEDVTVTGNIAQGYSIMSTQASASLYQQDATVWGFNFTDYLLFPSIKSVTYSIEIEGTAFARHASRPPVGNYVEVVTDVPVSGTVYISVDQSTPSIPITASKKSRARHDL